MRRRDLIALPAAALLPADTRRPVPPCSRVVSLVLDQADPYAQLDRLWRFGAPLRVVARAHPAWWPSGVELPDRWQAWVETRGGPAVRIVCRPRAAVRPECLSNAGRVSALIAQALRLA